jgi:hypothetical protein
MEAAGRLPVEFRAVRCADLEEQERRVAELAGGAPFLALAPMRAKSIVRDFEPFVFTLGDCAIAAGFLREARVGRSLVLVLATPIAEPEAFWAGVRGFLREQRASALVVESVGAERPEVPALAGEGERLRAETYVIDLAGHEARAALASNHRRNVQRALRAGVELQRHAAPGAAASHLALVRASLDRVAARGEDVEGMPAEAALRAYLASGRGLLFQAVLGGEVRSSDLVVRIGDAAYYLSGGSSPEGMKVGTAHFLMAQVIESLKQAGCRTLNLGYPNAPGLARFKEGFGARPVPVERVQAELRGGLPAALLRLLARLRR